MYCELDHLERCVFLHGVQHAAINMLEVFIDIVEFWPILLYFMEIFVAKKIQVFKNGSKLVPFDKLGI